MRVTICNIIISVCLILIWVGHSDATPPTRIDMGIRPLVDHAGWDNVPLEFYFTPYDTSVKKVSLSFYPHGDLTYDGPNDVQLVLNEDSLFIWQFEVYPNQFDTSSIWVLAWINDSTSRVSAWFTFTPDESGLRMGRAPDRTKRMKEVNRRPYNRVAIGPHPYPPPGWQPEESPEARERRKESARVVQLSSMNSKRRWMKELEQVSLYYLDVQKILIGDTVYTRKRDERLFHPQLPDTGFATRLAMNQPTQPRTWTRYPPKKHHISVECQNRDCVAFLCEIADTVFTVPWSDRYQLTVGRKGMLSLRRKGYEIFAGQHQRPAPQESTPATPASYRPVRKTIAPPQPPDSTHIRKHQKALEDQARHAVNQLRDQHAINVQIQRKEALELAPLTARASQSIRIGDTLYTRKRGEHYFHPTAETEVRQ